MGRILKSLAPYWKSVIVIVVLLVVQAICDLSLPQFTSNIIDTGIQNGGVEHIFPEKITSEEFELAKILMTEDEKKIWDDSYNKEGDAYTLSLKDEKLLDKYDESMAIPLIINNQMSSMTEKAFKDMLKQQMSAMSGGASVPGVPSIEEMSVEQISQLMSMTLKQEIKLETFTKIVDDADGNSVETQCVDVRGIINAFSKAGMLTESNVIEMRNEVKKMVDTMGTSLVKSMGIAYAKSMDEKAGMDMEAIQTGYLWKSGAKMIAMALLIMAATILVGFFASKVGAGIGRSLRESIYIKVMGFSNAEMDKFSTASLITRNTNDVQQVQMVTVIMLRIILYAPILAIGGVVKVIGTGAGMGWIIGLGIMAILVVIMVLMNVAMPKFKIMQKLVDNVNLVSREILTGLSVIRAFGREKKEEQRFDEANVRLTKNSLFTSRCMAFMMPVMTIIMNGLSILIVWTAAHKIDEGTLQVGAMTAFITYTMMIVMSFLMMSMISIMLPRAIVAAERIDEVLNTRVTIQDPTNPKELKDVKGIVKFDHVSFKYPGAVKNVIEDIDFVAEPGKTTAIIGSTGCGKSTLVNLIPRLYDATTGSVSIDGVNVKEISMHDLRQQLGYVPQKGVLFTGTIESNIKFGKEDASNEQMVEAATIAQATEFIESKKDEYNSSIAQGGTNVSGGQKQRLSIARAIAKQPKIFVFDDSFSALDLKTDAALRKALSEKVKDSTVIIVAQRISTILHADQIIVMDEGRIAGKGTHEELIRNCEVYIEIAKSQLSAKELGLEETNNDEAVAGATNDAARNVDAMSADATNVNGTNTSVANNGKEDN